MSDFLGEAAAFAFFGGATFRDIDEGADCAARLASGVEQWAAYSRRRTIRPSSWITSISWSRISRPSRAEICIGN